MKRALGTGLASMSVLRKLQSALDPDEGMFMTENETASSELREFVRASLVDVASAVTDAQDELASGGTKVNPPFPNHELVEKAGKMLSQGGLIQELEFDIAVTATRESEAGGKIRIKVLQFVQGEGGGTQQSLNSSVSRLRFSVPVVFRESPIRG